MLDCSGADRVYTCVIRSDRPVQLGGACCSNVVVALFTVIARCKAIEHLYRARSLLLLGSLVSLLLAVLLTGCGGGGGAAPAPIAEVVVNGIVEVLSGTPRSRDVSGGAPLPKAIVRAYLTTQPTTPIAEATTDADGRYTLRLPQTAAGRDILIVAEKTISGQRVRVTGLVAALPTQGYAGANSGRDYHLSHGRDSALRACARLEPTLPERDCRGH